MHLTSLLANFLLLAATAQALVDKRQPTDVTPDYWSQPGRRAARRSLGRRGTPSFRMPTATPYVVTHNGTAVTMAPALPAELQRLLDSDGWKGARHQAACTSPAALAATASEPRPLLPPRDRAAAPAQSPQRRIRKAQPTGAGSRLRRPESQTPLWALEKRTKYRRAAMAALDCHRVTALRSTDGVAAAGSPRGGLSTRQSTRC